MLHNSLRFGAQTFSRSRNSSTHQGILILTPRAFASGSHSHFPNTGSSSSNSTLREADNGSKRYPEAHSRGFSGLSRVPTSSKRPYGHVEHKNVGVAGPAGSADHSKHFFTAEEWAAMGSKGEKEELSQLQDLGAKPKAFTSGQLDFIHKWSRKKFWIGAGVLWTGFGTLSLAMDSFMYGLPSACYLAFPAIYTWRGVKDMNQIQKTLPRNYPFLIWFRYICESVRPEMRQYFFETDHDQTPYSRTYRKLIYERAKGGGTSIPFGTQHNVYDGEYEWINHSILSATHCPVENSRVMIGEPSKRVKNDCEVKPYNASLLNISAMSYGALSRNAQKSLNFGARMGNFYHNTGEGGVSPYHKYAQADVVWNIGTGYFGARNKETGRFCEKTFLQTLEESPGIKMLEVKLSQGAKPGHGGILPKEKLTKELSEIRGVPMGEDCNSPPWHSEFNSPDSMMEFCHKLRKMSNKPVGFKLCLGNPVEFVAIVKAIERYPSKCIDFITVDGAEGGTGAAPMEFTNRVGTPLRDGLIFVDDVLRGAGIRDDIKIIASGRVTHGFSIIRAKAMGADVCNAARAMMFALGCIQSLQCNTNKCPTGVATMDENLMQALHVPSKAIRVRNYQDETVHAACELVGAAGLTDPSLINRSHIMMRNGPSKWESMEERFPTVQSGVLLRGEGQERYQKLWDRCV